MIRAGVKGQAANFSNPKEGVQLAGGLSTPETIKTGDRFRHFRDGHSDVQSQEKLRYYMI